MSKLTELSQWQDLEALSQRAIVKEFNGNYILECASISFDYSRHNINQEILDKLIEFAEISGLSQAIDDYFSGKKINFTESRAALHTALRAPFEKTALRVGAEIAASVQHALTKMATISHQVRHSKWLGYTGEPIKNVVNIGIGGSDLGPRMSVTALKEFNDSGLRFYFISDADPTSFDDVIENLEPETTLFIISSKSFTTKETLMNAKKAREWLNQETNIDKHFIAVTAEPQRAKSFGFNTILPIWDWVGGRFSLCSAINVILMIAIGVDDFYRLLLGFYKVDEHFRSTDYSKNIPVIMALLGVWNTSFMNASSHCMLIYNSRLKYLVPYLQQLEMESNGKNIDKNGRLTNYKTCPIIWGGLGNQAQHAYYQLLSQGSHHMSIDFIIDSSKEGELINDFARNKLKALSEGQKTNTLYHIEGQVPLSQLVIESLSPETLGQLIALYEHKVFTKGVLWRVNSFDQFGVESSKRIMHAQLSIADNLKS